MRLFNRESKPNIKKLERDGNIDGLLDALNHQEMSIRREAANALGRCKASKSVDPLIKILTDTTLITPEYLYLKGDVAKALGEIGDKRAEKYLAKAAKTEYTASGGFTSFEDLVRQGAEIKEKIDYLNNSAQGALQKIRSKKE